VVADRETRRLSFGSVATDYDRYRPPPPPQALDWLIPSGAQAILDLAAGTGVVTRELIGRAARVVAVEPDERMRAVLAASCPEAEVLAGRGEDIPLPAGSVDAVVISAAWHWLDPGRAVPEITRVLRPGGRLGVIWISRDMRVPWVAEFNAFARESREADRPADSGRRHREVVFPPGFTNREGEPLPLKFEGQSILECRPMFSAFGEPRQLPLITREQNGAADAVPNGVGIPIGEIGLAFILLIPHVRNRIVIRPKWSAG
jgi:SAM-dependent methyltransferase